MDTVNRKKLFSVSLIASPNVVLFKCLPEKLGLRSLNG